MISAVSSGYGIQVTGGYHSLPYISSNSTNPVTGMIRINGSNLEAFTGTGWLGITRSAAHLELDDQVAEIIKWAEQKMVEESRIKDLIKNHPEIGDLKDKLEMLIILASDHHEQLDI